jgi:hypothetical protein
MTKTTKTDVKKQQLRVKNALDLLATYWTEARDPKNRFSRQSIVDALEKQGVLLTKVERKPLENKVYTAEELRELARKRLTDYTTRAAPPPELIAGLEALVKDRIPEHAEELNRNSVLASMPLEELTKELEFRGYAVITKSLLGDLIKKS